VVPEEMDQEQSFHPDITELDLSTLLNTIHNQFEHECLDEVVRLLNVHPFRHSTDDCVPGHK
jgi:hypothetical protein